MEKSGRSVGAIIGFILAIVGIVWVVFFLLGPLIAIVLGVVAIILAILSRCAVGKNIFNNLSLILGIISAALGVVTLILNTVL